LAKPSSDATSKTFGTYELGNKVGEGGMASVYSDDGHKRLSKRQFSIEQHKGATVIKLAQRTLLCLLTVNELTRPSHLQGGAKASRAIIRCHEQTTPDFRSATSIGGLIM